MEGSSSGEDGSENVDQIISDGESDHDMPSCGNQEQTENSEYDFLPTLDRDIFPGSTRRLNEARFVLDTKSSIRVASFVKQKCAQHFFAQLAKWIAEEDTIKETES